MKKVLAIFMLLAIMFIMATVAFGQTTTTSNTVTTFNAAGDTIATTTVDVKTVTVVIKKFVPGSPPTTGTNPGGKSSNPVYYQNLNGTLITGLSFDGANAAKDLITLNNCTNVHVTLCRFSNTTGISVRLINCINCTVDYCYFTMVNFAVFATNSPGTKSNYNQGLNLNGPDQKYNGNFAHWVQYLNTSGPGLQVNYNRFLSKDGVAKHPHDAISLDAVSGTTSSPVQIYGNWIKGGQIAGGYPGAGDTGVGITAPDVSGSNYDIKKNIVVNSGVNGMLVVANGSNIVIDSCTIVNDNKNAKVAYDGFTIKGTLLNVTISNLRVRWMQPTGTYLGLWLGASGKTTYTGVTFKNNNWNDTSLTSAILQDSMITYK